MPVTLACQDHLLAGTTLLERLTNLTSYGFEAVELLGRGLLDRLAETRSALAQTGVPVAAICAGFEGSLLHPEPAQRRLALDGIKRLLDVADELGADQPRRSRTADGASAGQRSASVHALRAVGVRP